MKGKRRCKKRRNGMEKIRLIDFTTFLSLKNRRAFFSSLLWLPSLPRFPCFSTPSTRRRENLDPDVATRGGIAPPPQQREQQHWASLVCRRRRCRCRIFFLVLFRRRRSRLPRRLPRKVQAPGLLDDGAADVPDRFHPEGRGQRRGSGDRRRPGQAEILILPAARSTRGQAAGALLLIRVQ